jgi:hypothetical protein
MRARAAVRGSGYDHASVAMADEHDFTQVSHFQHCDYVLDV